MFLRITPAYAGKSFFLMFIVRLQKDHPRLCGEKPSMNKFPSTEIGSPPPMRGKVPYRRETKFSVGITPAYAGKSTSNTVSGKTNQGSPPPMRGKVATTGTKSTYKRITPAYAGKRPHQWTAGKC